MHYATKSMLLDALRNLPRTVFNIVSWARTNPSVSNASLLRNLVLSMPPSEQEPFASECRFVRSMPLDNLRSLMFPYKARGVEDDESRRKVEIGRENGLPYVVLPSARRLYFPKSTSNAAMLENYIGLMFVEGITGAGVLEKSPHCYQNSDFFIEKGDCLLDIGCAEGLFTIENIDKISRGILFECEPFWARPLAATFRPYHDKVQIVERMVSSHTSSKTIRVMDAIANVADADASFFVKMDIEGAEREVIKGNEDFFRKKKIKLSCCVYHRQDDAVVIREALEKLGYKTRFSDGYMLVDMNGINFPYFRRGVIYAWNY